MTWANLREPFFPWARSVHRIVGAQRPPHLGGKQLVIATDSSGTNHTSDYRVNAYLCIDTVASIGFERERRHIRSKYLRDSRRMSYKALSDRRRSDALAPFLEAARHLVGVCLVVIVNKRLRHLCFRNADDYEQLRVSANLTSRWKDAELEEAVRATYTVAVLLGSLSQPQQRVLWLSDEDNLFSNQAHARDVARLLATFSEYHVPHMLEQRHIATTALDDANRKLEDIVTVADLAAGGIAEAVNRVAAKCGGRIPHNLAIEFNEALSQKSDFITRWFWGAPGALARVAVRFDEHPDAYYSVSKWEMR
jgi:hypothetical protein